MFDHNPVLKERIMGLSAIAAIGVGGLAAVDLVVTGGFDFAGGRAPYDREQPSAYVRMVDAARYVGESFNSISWDQPMANEAAAATTDDLAGDDDGSPPPDLFTETEDGDLYEQIVALYAEDEPYVEEPSYEDAAAIDAEPAEPVYEEPAYGEPTADDGYHEDDDAYGTDKG
jgi:hypothetical protein